MSNNFNTPSGWELEKSTETANIIPLPVERKQELVKETQDELKLLTKDMQKISHADFLTKVEHADRLKHLTDPNIDSSEISENTKIEFNFSFTSEKRNDRLYLLTTAGQVLPASVSILTTSDGKEYSRESISWEFFASDGKRLKIHDKTQITIWELRDEEAIEELEQESADKLKNSGSIIKDENRELLSMWASKWIDPELVLKFFSAFFGTSDTSKIDSWKYEDFLTQVDREIGYMNMDEKTIDKNNLTENDKEELTDRMGNKTSMESIDYENIEIWSYKRFLDFISQAEGTQGNYDAIFGNWSQSEIKITSMKLREVLYYQKNTLLAAQWHTPIGKYQFNIETLEDYIDRFGFSLDQKVDIDFQDKIAMIKMKESGLSEFQAWKISQKDFEVKIAWTWAGFPKDATWKSYYDWVAWNKAQVAYSDYTKEISYLRHAV